MERRYFALGSLSALIGVAAGAFGAHALKARLAPDMLVGLRNRRALPAGARPGAAGDGLGRRPLARPPSRPPRVALFVAGIVLFSGSLYALALTGRARWVSSRRSAAWRSSWDGAAWCGRQARDSDAAR